MIALSIASLSFLTFALSEAGFISTGLEKYWGVSNNAGQALEQASNKTYKASGNLEIIFEESANQEAFSANKVYKYKFVDTPDKFEYSLANENQAVSLSNNPASINWQGFLQVLSENINNTGKRSGGKTLNGVASKTFKAQSNNSEILKAILPFIGFTQSNLEIEFSVARRSKEINQIILQGNFLGNNLKGKVEGQIVFEAL